MAAVVDATYGFHLERGNKLEQSEDWTGAIKEFEKAAGIKDTTEAHDSLKNAQKQLVITQDKAAAQKALAASTDFQAQHNMIRAYEVLASLPASQQALVADEMKTLEPAYVLAAAQEAKTLHQAHSPIRGLADEVGIEKAYVYLQNAYQLSENDSYKDKLDLDGNELSAYLLDQAKHYLAKPGGSRHGAGLEVSGGGPPVQGLQPGCGARCDCGGLAGPCDALQAVDSRSVPRSDLAARQPGRGRAVGKRHYYRPGEFGSSGQGGARRRNHRRGAGLRVGWRRAGPPSVGGSHHRAAGVGVPRR